MYVSRYLDERNEPQFPFGHGLSYTTFRYDGPAESGVDASFKAPCATCGIEPRVSAEVTNTGSRPGEEVVQLYVRLMGTSVSQPVRALKGFQRVALAPGETKTVTFQLSPMPLRCGTIATSGSSSRRKRPCGSAPIRRKARRPSPDPAVESRAASRPCCSGSPGCRPPHCAETILFVGNSFTAGAVPQVERFRPETVTDLNREGVGGIPALFKTFARQSGLAYDVHLETAGGTNLDFHYRRESGADRARLGSRRRAGLQHARRGFARQHRRDHRVRRERSRGFSTTRIRRSTCGCSRPGRAPTRPTSQSGHWFGKPIDAMATTYAPHTTRRPGAHRRSAR